MRASGFESPARDRFLKAVACVMALLLMVPGVDALLKVVRPPSWVAAAGLDASAFVRGSDPFSVLDELEGFAVADDVDVPEALAREVGFLSGAHDIHVDDTGSVLGYAVQADASETAERLVEQMESRGWTAVQLGGIDGATFVKSDGECTWALATCTQVDQWTSVVVRCMYS